jgi:hypothetical protein
MFSSEVESGGARFYFRNPVSALFALWATRPERW